MEKVPVDSTNRRSCSILRNTAFDRNHESLIIIIVRLDFSQSQIPYDVLALICDLGHYVPLCRHVFARMH